MNDSLTWLALWGWNTEARKSEQKIAKIERQALNELSYPRNRSAAFKLKIMRPSKPLGVRPHRYFSLFFAGF